MRNQDGLYRAASPGLSVQEAKDCFALHEIAKPGDDAEVDQFSGVPVRACNLARCCLVQGLLQLRQFIQGRFVTFVLRKANFFVTFSLCWCAGAPGELQHGITGICFKQEHPAQPLMKHFLEHGRLDPGMAATLAPMLVLCKTRATRYREKSVGTKSRVQLDTQ